MKMEDTDEKRSEKEKKLESRERDLYIVQTGTKREFLTGTGMAPHPVKQEPVEGLQEGWEGQWQEFLKTTQASHLGCRASMLPLFHEEESPPEFWASSFKGLTEGHLWSGEDCVTRTQPGLTYEVHGASESSLNSSVKVKEEMAEEKTVSLEMRRQHFRRFCYWEAEGPRDVCWHLQGLCRQWLRPERHSLEQILELVTLEQFLLVLPHEMQRWVRQGGPETCAQAVTLAERFLQGLAGTGKSEKQVTETAGGMKVSISNSSQDPADKLKSQLATDVKQETDGESSLLGDGRQKKESQVELSRTSLKRTERNVFLLPELEDMCGRSVELQRFIGNNPQMEGKETSSLWESKEDFEEMEGVHLPKMKEAGIECKINLSQNSPSLMNQILETVDKPYKCSDCGRGFHQKPYLRVHERTHTGEKPYKCLDCGKSFNRRTGLCSHQRVHTGEKPYRCSYCGKCFTGTGSLKEHERTHTGEKPHTCLYCGKSFNRRGVLCKHKRLHTGEKPYSCSYCARNFSQRSHLISHERTHTGEKPYGCSECGKSFRQSNDLSRHQKIHKGEKSYKCAECGEAFYQKVYLIRHEKIHTGEEPYECSDCGKTFYQQANLNAHKKIHTEDKPFHCFECGKSFHQSSDLCRHQTIHNGEKLHKCLECGEGFCQLAYLIRHERTHTEQKQYACSDGGKSFCQQAHLNAHKKIHMEDKPYYCFECGKSFHQSSDLCRHQSIHSGEEQHECPECGKTFHHRVYLMRHVRTHT